MPSLERMRRISSVLNYGGKTISEIHKANSDFAMEFTWDNNIQSKVCYIYDYWHDNHVELFNSFTYDDTTTKTKIDAKFIISSYGSIDKDQVAYHIMFRPSEKLTFDENDDMYYYETDYKDKYDMLYPIGMYIDIPDDRGVYNRWLICGYEQANQFVKYNVLPCDYRLQWVSTEGNKRFKRQMWCCTRSMNSYTSGVWIDRYMYSLDNINKLILPLNTITDKLNYLNDNGTNQRLILSAKTENPLAWKVTKIENTKPIGLVKATLKQDIYNPHTDYIERDSFGKIIGMYADYYDSNISAENEPITSTDHIELASSTYNIKVNGSYKLIQCIYKNQDDEDISDEYSSVIHEWTYTIDDIDVSDLITVLEQTDKNKIKIKFNNYTSYIGKSLIIGCSVNNVTNTTQLNIIA